MELTVCIFCWNKRAAGKFQSCEFPVSVDARLADFFAFLHLRSDRHGQPLSESFAAPQQHNHQWFRLQWPPAGGDAAITSLEKDGWVRAWHGPNWRHCTHKTALEGYLSIAIGLQVNAILQVHQECTCTKTPLRLNQTTTPSLSMWFPAPRSTQFHGRFALIGHTVSVSHALQTNGPNIQINLRWLRYVSAQGITRIW